MLAVKRFIFAVPGIFQRFAGDHQGYKLRYIGHFQDIGRQAKFHRVKVDIRDEAAPLAVRLVRRGGVGIVVIFNAPA